MLMLRTINEHTTYEAITRGQQDACFLPLCFSKKAP